jgi:purine-binding chemotaxis protein CheW
VRATPFLKPGEFLSFRLGEEEYGIDILNVQEIRSYEKPTRIANAPATIKGVVNLRGVIVPLLDLRVAFGLEDKPCDVSTVIIVLNIMSRVTGVIVDAVNDVVRLEAEHLRPPPEFNASIDARALSAIACVQDRMLSMLDLRMVISATMGIGEDLVPV